MHHAILIFAAILSGPFMAMDSSKDSIQDIFARSAPAVVKIYGASLGRQQGYGTGTLVSADGQIITQNSVLLTSRTVRVVLQDGRRFDAQLSREDNGRKLALLKIDAENLPFLTPTPTNDLKLGDTVLGLGNWFKIADGQEPVSLTRGVFSVKTRVDTRRLAQEYEFDGPVLVYDAITSNPGAAGGPLLDDRGRFVGLVGTIVESAQTNTRINYAVPGEELIAFLKGEKGISTPVATGSHSNGSTSSGAPVDLGIVLSKLGYRQVSAFVEKVKRNSPAARAGIKTDDLIMVVDGRRITSADDFNKAMSQVMSGQRVQIVVKRGEQVLTLEVLAGE